MTQLQSGALMLYVERMRGLLNDLRRQSVWHRDFGGFDRRIDELLAEDPLNNETVKASVWTMRDTDRCQACHHQMMWHNGGGNYVCTYSTGGGETCLCSHHVGNNEIKTTIEYTDEDEEHVDSMTTCDTCGHTAIDHGKRVVCLPNSSDFVTYQSACRVGITNEFSPTCECLEFTWTHPAHKTVEERLERLEAQLDPDRLAERLDELDNKTNERIKNLLTAHRELLKTQGAMDRGIESMRRDIEKRVTHDGFAEWTRQHDESMHLDLLRIEEKLDRHMRLAGHE